MTCTGDEITVVPRRKSLVRFSAGEDAGERPRPIQRIPTRVELTTLTRMAKRPAVDIEFQDLCFTAGQSVLNLYTLVLVSSVSCSPVGNNQQLFYKGFVKKQLINVFTVVNLTFIRKYGSYNR